MRFARAIGVRVRLLVVGVVVVCVVGCVGVSSAFGVEASARLGLHVLGLPSRMSGVYNEECEHFLPEEEAPCDTYQVTVTNTGSRAARGPVVVSDVLPAGLSVTSNPEKAVLLYWAKDPLNQHDAEELPEGPPGQPIGGCTVESPSRVSCELATSTGELRPNYRLEMDIGVVVAGGATDAPNTVVVSEEGVPVARSEEDDVIAAGAPSFGPSFFSSPLVSADGEGDTQAGDHPYGLSTRFDLNTAMELDSESTQVEPTAVGQLRDVVVDLPVGVVGSAVATPKCTFGQLQTYPTSCPPDTIVGKVTSEPSFVGAVNSPVFNMVPKKGTAAEFGFDDLLYHTHVIVSNLVPSPQGYVLQAVAREIPDVPLTDVISSFYGVPAEHNQGGASASAMFTNPSDCSGEPLQTRLFVDSWLDPASFEGDGEPTDLAEAAWQQASSSSPPVTGCDQLRFNATMSAQPDTGAGDSPTGLSFELRVPQTEAPGTLGTPPLRDARVTMPVGMTVDPSSANGLEACSEAQIGWLGATAGGQPLANQGLTNFTAAGPSCPEASKIGSVEVATPLLEKPVVGAVYLARQDENPFGSLLAAYIVIDDPTTGTIVKVPGRLETNPETGQITGVFDENPQLPFSDFKLRFFGGSRGELATPQSCGTFTTTSDLMPWSAPDSGPDATPSSSFQVNSNCTFSFSPSFQAGMENNQAAAFSPFTLTVARQDGEQHLAGVTVTTPPGLLAVLKNVVQCPEPQASQGQCGPESLIGEATVASGVGPEPYVVKGGRVYLTGPYNDGPFGLSVVVPAIAGPFDLGNVVVRSSIRVNPATTQVTVVSDPLPQMVNSIEGLNSGIPTDTRTINVTINRPNFEFNPTNCAPLAITGTLTGAQGATDTVASPFRAANCATLPFHPSFQASTQGNASKANGASFTVRVASSPGQANIAKTDLTLPVQLPSRLSTLQKACLESVFNINPAACDEGSVIGTATVHTPDLKSPLTGPAYLVAHGGAEFPDVEFVLQGEGITLVLDGKTDIKKGITYSKFETVPDAPIETFETVLPTGPHSALTAYLPKSSYDLCGTSLLMPTTITGQNGAVINQTTKITVTGCPKTKTKTRAEKLAAALKACHKHKNKKKRAACETNAHKKYGPTHKTHKK